MTPNAPLQLLVGAELSSVCFVRDYVEFHFDGPVLRAMTPVQLSRLDAHQEEQLRATRDALCALIGATVLASSITEDVDIRIAFNSKIELVVPLDAASRGGREAAHFVSGGQNPFFFSW